MVVSWIDDDGKAGEFPEDVFLSIGTFFSETLKTSRNSLSRILVNIAMGNELATYRFRVQTGNWSKTIRLVKDAQPPSARLNLVSERDIKNAHEYQLRVTFGSSVIYKTQYANCLEVPVISRDNPIQLVLERSNACSVNLLHRRLVNGVHVRGANLIRRIKNGANSVIFMLIRTPTNLQAYDINISLADGFSDFAGNALVENPSLTLYYRPVTGMPSIERIDRLRRRAIKLPNVGSNAAARVVGRAASVAVVGTCATSLVSSTGTGSGAGSATMLNNVQKMHMTGLLAVTNMPDSYKNFTNENKTSSSGNSSSTTANRRSLKIVESSLEAGDDENEFDYFERIMFWVPLLFVLVTLIHVIFLLVFFLKRWEIPDILQIPRIELMLSFFLLPPISIAAAGLYQGNREDALLGTWIIIAIPINFLAWNFLMLWYYILRLPPHMREANQITDLPSQKQKALKRLRTVFFVSKRGSGGSLWGSNGVRRSLRSSRKSSQDSLHPKEMNVLTSSQHQENGPSLERQATMYNFDEEVVRNPHDPDEEASEDQALTCSEFYDILSNMNMLTLLFGEHQEDADWKSTRVQGSKFVAKYGPLFEDYRGPAIGRKDATLDVDPVTRKVDRGTLVIIKERPLVAFPQIGIEGSTFFFPGKKIYRYHLQMLAKILDISKTILVGCIVAGVGNSDDNITSIVALIVLSLILLFLFRLAKPFPSRLDMFLLLLVELADLIVYTCALFLLLGGDADEETYDNVGRALILSEGFALIALIIEYALISIGISLLAWDMYTDTRKVKFFEAVYLCMKKDGRYLERKYFDLWMVRVFQMGLKGRIPEQHELRWNYVVKMYFASLGNTFQWFIAEMHQISLDCKQKLHFYVES